MSKDKLSSYIGELSSGYESDTVKEYDPAKGEGQLGKAHEEEVAPKNNWGEDKRDAVGKAASVSKFKRLSSKLRRIAREIDAMTLDKKYVEVLDDAVEQAQEEVKGISPAEMQDEPEDLKKMTDEEIEEKCKMKGSNLDEYIVMKATHPIDHDTAKDNPEANMSSQTGDEDWIDIGPGSFDDPRDEAGRAN